MIKGLAIVLCLSAGAIRTPYPVVQLPDLLILGKDTLVLRNFPLEELNFQERPFQYGAYSYPDIHCLRGYQATWKVIGKKLFLWNLSKIDDPGAQLDLPAYFEENDYHPQVIDGHVFANWYTMQLMSIPSHRLKCVFLEKRYKAHRSKVTLRFDKGLLKVNRYKAGKKKHR